MKQPKEQIPFAMAEGAAEESPHRADTLRKEIAEHDLSYHRDDAPVVSDLEYDRLAAELRALESDDPDAPERPVGAPPRPDLPTVRHPEPMLSLANAFTEEDFRAWHKRMADHCGTSHFPMSAEPKIDGLAIRLLYRDGDLTMGVTRGDGLTGENVTANVKNVLDLPGKLQGTLRATPSGDIQARGEVYMPKSAFHLVNLEREEQGEYQYANPRNAAAGTLRQSDPELTASRGLRAWVYSNQSPAPGQGSHVLSLEDLQQAGLPVNPLNRLYFSIEEVLRFHQEMMDLRTSLDYETDGIVVKMDLLAVQESLGSTGHEPRWAVAWKFPAERAVTKLIGINISIGRFGKLTPVAQLEPINLAGVTIQSASLHNEEDLHRKDIRAGDQVIIERAGDVIPQVLGPLDPDPYRETVQFSMPTACPACQGPVDHDNEAAHWCRNHDCASRLSEQLKHFVSKRAMDIDGMGEHWCQALIRAGLVEDISDLYQLTMKDLLTLDRMGQKLASRLLENIDDSRTSPLDRVLYGLGVYRLGRKVSGLLAQEYTSVEEIASLSLEELAGHQAIGPKIAQSVHEAFRTEKLMKTIAGLEAGGVKTKREKTEMTQAIQTEQEEQPGGSPFAGKICVVTGKIDDMTRTEAEEAIGRRGGIPSSSVTTKTDMLIVGGKPGSKLDKARKLGVRIITSSEFIGMLRE